MPTKLGEDAVLDAALNVIKTTGSRMTVCSDNPARTGGAASTIAQINAVRLAEQTGMATGDYTIADGTTGRKVTVAAKNALSISASGTAQVVCIDNGTALLYATTCTAQPLTSGGTLNVPSWSITIADPT